MATMESTFGTIEERQEEINFWNKYVINADNKLKIANNKYKEYKKLIESLKAVQKEFFNNGDYDQSITRALESKNKILENLNFDCISLLRTKFHYELQYDCSVAKWKFIEFAEVLDIDINEIIKIVNMEPSNEYDGGKKSLEFWRMQTEFLL
jgi:hypothetical protein